MARVTRTTWTKEKCHEEALKYQGRWEFQKSSRNAYMAAQRSGWLGDIFAHMRAPKRSGNWTSDRKPPKFWTKYRCHTEALKYQGRWAFQKGSKSAYLSAFKHGWLDELCSHMKSLDYGLLCGYVIYNDRLRKAYVGITARPFSVRIAQHQSDNTTLSRVITDEPDTRWEQVTEHSYLPEEAKKLEEMLYEEYSEKGYELLNSKSALGGVGGSELKWDQQALADEARRFKSITEFAIDSKSAYNAALRQGLIDEVCAHMERRKLPDGHWNNKEKCHEEALKYRTITAFRRKRSGAAQVAAKNGWLDDICSHMDRPHRPSGHWQIKENCQSEALKYQTRSEFRERCSGAAHAAKMNGWFDEICSHMPKTQNKPPSYWTKEMCQQEALKHRSRSAFRKAADGAYDIARKRGWLDEICSHMKRTQKPERY